MWIEQLGECFHLYNCYVNGRGSNHQALFHVIHHVMHFSNNSFILSLNFSFIFMWTPLYHTMIIGLESNTYKSDHSYYFVSIIMHYRFNVGAIYSLGGWFNLYVQEGPLISFFLNKWNYITIKGIFYLLKTRIKGKNSFENNVMYTIYFFNLACYDHWACLLI